MGLVWNMSAAIATVAILLIGGAIYKKGKNKKDSPLYGLMDKFKKKNKEETGEETIHYRRLSHKSGIKW